MPTHEWTLAEDPYGGGGRGTSKKALIIAAVIMGVTGLIVVLGFLVPTLSGDGTPKVGSKPYNARVECQVNTVGGAGTVTVSGTITGDSSRFKVTVEVLDSATKQRIGEATFDVRDTTTFGGTTPAQAPVGPAGIECRIAKVA
ncbi:hypothetical protein E1293_40740 [Actinomadura darangshiensis]|uniref:Uncharacterized protein n=1 Tax=Actinomadura darangshiensis TaxID=705336 RepID=A0A4R5A045_9ACTN|nr:hypothetical protein [Actinomadura darangshiensis]TDD65041.1 hypothetical protein E1293_40740 [Actinomadura darangshiensis]